MTQFQLLCSRWLIDPAREGDPQQSATSSNTRLPLSRQPKQPNQQQEQSQQQQRRRSNYAPIMGAPSAGPVMPLPPPPLGPLPVRTPTLSTADLAASGRRAMAANQEQQRRAKKKISSEARLLLSEDCLSLLIALLTELPRPAGRASARSALRREVVHRLASSECTHSEIASVVANLTDVRIALFLSFCGLV